MERESVAIRINAGGGAPSVGVFVSAVAVVLKQYVLHDKVELNVSRCGSPSQVVVVDCAGNTRFSDVVVRLEGDLSDNLQRCVNLDDVAIVALEVSPQWIGLCVAPARSDERRALDAALIGVPSAAERHLRGVLAAVKTSPSMTIAELSAPLPNEVREVILAGAGATERYPLQCIQELIERQARASPDSSALFFQSQVLSRSAVDRAANLVAADLKRIGVIAGQYVGVLCHRGPAAVIGLLGVLKAGAVYVPLDPNLPAHRLKVMIEDCQPCAIVREASLSRYALPITLPSVDVGVGNPGNEESCGFCPVSLDDPAFVIYTSGSTGAPKGAIQVHRSLVSRLAGNSLPDITVNDVCGLTTSFSFGITVSRLLLPLALGSPVVVFDEKDMRDPLQYATTVARYGVTSVFVVPDFLRLLLDVEPDVLGRLSSLRVVAVAGGRTSTDLARLFYERLPSVDLVNLYGSTEIGSTAAFCTVPRKIGPIITAGRPAPNTKIYVLDKDRSPVRFCVPGDLYVASRHLSRGYVGDPDKTAEVLFRDPFDVGTGASLMCKTGDTGRFLANGEVEIIGRSDSQVKVRGFRVELGEIESTLLLHAKVREAAAVARDEGLGLRITAYVTSQRVTRVTMATSEELREFLRAQLPDYMIPTAIYILDRLPVTSTGKVDRAALLPSAAERVSLPENTEILNSFAMELAEIWGRLFGCQVGIDENFFSLGGDSLIGVRITSRIRQAYRLECGLSLIFDHPTPRSLAEVLRPVQKEVSYGVLTLAESPDDKCEVTKGNEYSVERFETGRYDEIL